MSDERAHGTGARPDPDSGEPIADFAAWFSESAEPAAADVADGERSHDLDELFARLDGHAASQAPEPPMQSELSVPAEPPAHEASESEWLLQAELPAQEPPVREEPAAREEPPPHEPPRNEPPARAEPPAEPYSAAASTSPAPGPSPRAESGNGLTRPQLIAMGVGVAVTLAGAGWALASPTGPAPAATSAPSASAVDVARVDAAIDAIDELSARVVSAKSSVTAFATPLAAMQGACDEAARTTAETARQTLERAVAAVVVPDRPDRSASPAALDAVEQSTSAASATLDSAVIAFHAAISTFVGTMPGYAVTVAAANPDASAELRDALTRSAALMASSDPFTPPGFAPWDGWRAALAALVADEAAARGEQRPPEESSPAPSPAPSAPPDAPPPVVVPPPPSSSPEPTPPEPTSPPPSTP